MPPVRLTKTLVEAVEAGPRDLFVWDGALKGFGLKVTPQRARSYIVQYRPRAGRSTRRYTLGRHGAPWTTERAREPAAELLARVRLGSDPFDEDEQRRASEAARVAAEAALVAAVHAAKAKAESEAFPLVVADFIERYAKPKNRRWAETQRVLTSDDLSAWSGRAITTITRREVMALIDEVNARSPGAARLVFAHLRKLFNWCVERLYIESSPCTGLKAPPPSKPRDRVLTDGEVRVVWKACGQLTPPFGDVIRLLLLTGQRREEVSAMRWSELDLPTRQWVVPGERAKNGQAHAVDLSDAALAIIVELQTAAAAKAKRLKRRDPEHVAPDFVFTTTGRTPISGHGKTKARLDDLIQAIRVTERRSAAPMPPWRVHDLRRTAATGMARLGYAPHVIEAVLNHRSGVRGGLVAVYQHYDHRSERKAALQAWGEHVMKVVDAEVEAPAGARSRKKTVSG